MPCIPVRPLIINLVKEIDDVRPGRGMTGTSAECRRHVRRQDTLPGLNTDQHGKEVEAVNGTVRRRSEERVDSSHHDNCGRTGG
jgi:hypothetical protein